MSQPRRRDLLHSSFAIIDDLKLENLRWKQLKTTASSNLLLQNVRDQAAAHIKFIKEYCIDS